MIFLLRNVLASYIDTLKERDFDIPLQCILLKNGFFDIHFLHGAFEFGKDFVAKKADGEKIIQYVFQSKGGNIGLSDWGQIRWQIEEAWINPLAHPSFNVELDRKVILVTTGRLVGGASPSAQQYAERCESEGKISFEVWDINSLLEMMLIGGANPYGLIEENPNLLSMVAKIKNNEGSFKEIEHYSRTWIERCQINNKQAFLGAILESTIFTHELRSSGRTTLACFVSLFPIRAIVHALHQSNDSLPKWAKDCLNIIQNHFLSCSEDVLEAVKVNANGRESIHDNHLDGFHAFIAYPVLCSQIMEILGLRGLLQIYRAEEKEAEEIANILDNLIKNNSGFFSPISDKYAVAIISPLLLLYIFQKTEVIIELLRKIAIWVCNRYEISDAGLASPYATEEEEIKTLLGYAYDFIDLPKRKESYFATVLLDSSALMGLTELYADILNDVLAVNILPCNVETEDIPGKYTLNGKAVYSPVVRFKEKLGLKEEWRQIEQQVTGETYCFKNNLWWELLSIMTVLRDRHYLYELQHTFTACKLKYDR